MRTLLKCRLPHIVTNELAAFSRGSGPGARGMLLSLGALYDGRKQVEWAASWFLFGVVWRHQRS